VAISSHRIDTSGGDNLQQLFLPKQEGVVPFWAIYRGFSTFTRNFDGRFPT
jgi:hypothetical protein